MTSLFITQVKKPENLIKRDKISVQVYICDGSKERLVGKTSTIKTTAIADFDPNATCPFRLNISSSEHIILKLFIHKFLKSDLLIDQVSINYTDIINGNQMNIPLKDDGNIHVLFKEEADASSVNPVSIMPTEMNTVPIAPASKDPVPMTPIEGDPVSIAYFHVCSIRSMEPCT